MASSCSSVTQFIKHIIYYVSNKRAERDCHRKKHDTVEEVAAVQKKLDKARKKKEQGEKMLTAEKSVSAHSRARSFVHCGVESTAQHYIWDLFTPTFHLMLTLTGPYRSE